MKWILCCSYTTFSTAMYPYVFTPIELMRKFEVILTILTFLPLTYKGFDYF